MKLAEASDISGMLFLNLAEEIIMMSSGHADNIHK
jgi:hypothetical protein